MVNKKSRSEIRMKKHARMRNRFSGTAERPRLPCLEVIIICMLKLSTIRLVTP